MTLKSQSTNTQNPVTILFTHYGDEWIRGSERCLLDLLNHLDREQFNPVVWCNNTIMADEVRSLNVPVFQSYFPLPGKQYQNFTINNFFGLLKQAAKIINIHEVKLIHANSGAPNQWLNIVARNHRVPLIAHLHSPYSLRDRVRLGLHHVGIAVGVSQYVIENLLKDGVSSEKICVIPNGIDTLKLDQQSRIDLRNKLKLDPSDFLIATIGSLIKRKGIDLIIDSIYNLVNLGIPIHFVIIGEGSEHNPLQQKINQLGLSKKVHMLGEQSNAVGLLNSGVDLFVSAPREEAFGLALAEASLAKLAVVATNVGGISDVIIDGKTGLLAPTEDIAALTQCIHKLYLKPKQREKMGKAGRRHVLINFTIQHNVKKFEQLYKQLLQNSAMRMHWFSHWELVSPFVNINKILFKLALKKINGARI